MCVTPPLPSKKSNLPFLRQVTDFIGAARRIRTPDPIITNDGGAVGSCSNCPTFGPRCLGGTPSSPGAVTKGEIVDKGVSACLGDPGFVNITQDASRRGVSSWHVIIREALRTGKRRLTASPKGS
jgi:hypothetical protein